MQPQSKSKDSPSVQQVQAEMNVLDQWRVDDMASNNTDSLWRQLKLFVEQAGAGLPTLRDRFARPALVLMAAVTMLLLLTCANVAGMMLARKQAFNVKSPFECRSAPAG